jgi:D-proline reductase (dithiol) PrdB
VATTAPTGFAAVEREYVRSHVYPSFDWLVYEQPSRRQPLTVPLERARVALVGTAGAHLRAQPPFARGREGDATYRVIPAENGELLLSHAGYDTRRASRDPETVFPLPLLQRLAQERVIGAVAPRAFSFMGYIPDPAVLLGETGPAVARLLTADAPDLVLLVPT